MEAKQWDQAVPLLKQAYEAQENLDTYEDYLRALLEIKDYKAAEALVQSRQKHDSSPLRNIDLGRVYAVSGRERKAQEQFAVAVNAVTGDEMLSQQMAAAFLAAGRTQEAILVYERTRSILQNPYLFAGSLTRLYAQTGDLAKAVDVLLSSGPSPFGGPDDTKATLLELTGDDEAKLQTVQKAIIRRINLQPDNTYYADILMWLYTQRNDWEGALLQVQAIDERTKGNGQGLLQFARMAQHEGQDEIALKSLDIVMEGGKSQPYYVMAWMQRMNIEMWRVSEQAKIDTAQLSKLAVNFEQFFKEYPEYRSSELVLVYATLEAQYRNHPQKAIEILENALTQPTASKEFVGKVKLQMGDYQILVGKVWDASLTYSQVDKAFREDAMGEEARYRNARLAYYRGDFEWAQAQLSALKASTSELIANDALNLSVLITENTPDSNNAALLQFAHADLLLFQNRYAEATRVLDSIAQVYPKHPLQDDVLMLRASMAMKQHDFDKALGFYERVYKEFGKDVLGDDAVFKMAELYEQKLNKPQEAAHYYEQLIIDYPGSTYVQLARARLTALQAPPHT
jgi:tetratricopeptide (TPR) repeat protein